MSSPQADWVVHLDIHGMVFGCACALIHHCTLSSLRSRKIQVKIVLTFVLMTFSDSRIECLTIIAGGLELLDTAFPRSSPLMAQFESGGSCCYASRFHGKP